MNPTHPRLYFILFIGAALCGALVVLWQWKETVIAVETSFATLPDVELPVGIPNREKPKQQAVKAIYLTAYSAGNPKKMDEIIQLLDTTELNAVVIDIKDYSGYVLYNSRVPLVNSLNTKRIQIKDVRGIIDRLHEHNMYAIARQTVFQDPILAEKKPEWAFQKKSGGVWRDHKGLAWVDTTQKEVWQYNIDIAKEAIRLGFDEINFDYVRFPSDGNMPQIVYANQGKARHEVMREFFSFVSEELMEWPAWISFDMFGLVMERHDGMNIGQRLEDAVPFGDYICPMMYASHYAPGHLGFDNPAEHPAEILENGLKKGMPYFEGKRGKVRPWIQAFNLGAVYDGSRMRAQIDAVEKYATDGWMLWNAGNRYTGEGLRAE